MAAFKWSLGQRVALKEDTTIRGRVQDIIAAYAPDASNLFQVRWDNFAQDYAYLEECLIDEKEIK